MRYLLTVHLQHVEDMLTTILQDEAGLSSGLADQHDSHHW